MVDKGEVECAKTASRQQQRTEGEKALLVVVVRCLTSSYSILVPGSSSLPSFKLRIPISNR